MERTEWSDTMAKAVLAKASRARPHMVTNDINEKTLAVWSESIEYAAKKLPKIGELWAEAVIRWATEPSSTERFDTHVLVRYGREVLQLWESDPVRKAELAEYRYAVNRQRFIDRGLVGEQLESQLLGQQISLHVDGDGKYVGPGGSVRPVSQVGRDRIRSILHGGAAS